MAQRQSQRHVFSCKGHFLNPLDWCGLIERQCVTRDFSRDGVYFITDETGLRENMRLVMRFPEIAQAAEDHEYLVEVRRLNSLPDDRCGVGARLILRTMLGRCRAMFAPERTMLHYSGLVVPSETGVDLYA